MTKIISKRNVFLELKGGMWVHLCVCMFMCVRDCVCVCVCLYLGVWVCMVGWMEYILKDSQLLSDREKTETLNNKTGAYNKI